MEQNMDPTLDHEHALCDPYKFPCSVCAEYWDRMRDEGFWVDGKGWTDKAREGVEQMNKLVEDYLTRAITERFEESLKEPDKCHEARDKVIQISLEAFSKTKGREGTGRRTIIRALEFAIADLETVRKYVQALEDDCVNDCIGQPKRDLLAILDGKFVFGWTDGRGRNERNENRKRGRAMNKPATCSLDPLTYDAFFRNGSNKSNEFAAIRRDDLDLLIFDLEAAQTRLRECPTCDGDGIMAAVVGNGPHDEELLEDIECEECHGTGVSSWGQAIDRAEKAEKELKEAQAEIATLRGQLAAYGAPDINGASMITNAGLGKDESEEQ